jgi:serine/threonine-protein kinase
MGTVWLARITGKHGFERQVALKTILSTYGNDRQFVDMFLDEARIAAQIDHENVARILEIGEDRGVLYHAMELVDGESLRKLYRDIRAVGAPFPLAVALRITADLCAGLQAVHELRDAEGVSLDVVHRDVSPQNVLITVRGTIKLIDFGVAKARSRVTEETTAGTLKGKIEYMPPEQASGGRIDRRADVYAVGAVLYELLAGEPVRSTEEGRQLLALHELMTGAPYEPLHSSVPAPVRAIVDRALSREPELRFRSAEDMRHALEQAMLAIGHIATADDVANVLGHFSRERITRRRDAIEAAVRVAQALERENVVSSSGVGGARGSLRTGEAALSAPSAAGRHYSSGSYGPQGTQVMDPNQPIVEGPRAIGEGPGTGPSMFTIQGASMSGAPPAMVASTAKIVGAVTVLALVATLGVVAGVLFSRNGMAPSGAKPVETYVPALPVTGSARAGESAAPASTPSPVTETASTAASASAPSTSAASTAPVVKPPPPKKPKPEAKPLRAPQKPESDEYGF